MRFSPLAWLCRLSLLAGSGLVACGGFAAAIANPLSLAALVLVLGWRRIHRWRHGSLSSQGTARFINHSDLARAGLLGETGLIVGRAVQSDRPTRRAALRSLVSPRTRSDDATRAFLAAFFRTKGDAGQFIRIRDYVHLATFAPTGRGKGQSVLKPNLLQFAGSVVVVDPDAELFRDVGEHRERAFGHRNIVLAPFGVPGRAGMACDTLNPMSFIDPDSPVFLEDCARLASLLVIRSGKETDSHWLDSAELILTAVIAFTIACEPDPKERTFQVVRGICSSPDRYGRTVECMKQVTGYGGVIARLGHQIQWYRDRELSSVLTTIGRLTSFLDFPAVAACTASSSFDPQILRGNVSLWLVLPSDRMQALAPVMRLWIGTILTRLTRDAADESRSVLFLIDEAANIGHIHQLEEAVTLMRKRGIRLWFCFQSLSQLSQCYGERAGVFLDNIDTQQYFGLNAYESAEAISKRLGQETILVTSHNASSGSSRQQGREPGSESRSSNAGSGFTVSEQGRALMRPEEVLQSGEAIIFHRNLPPILAALPLAHADPEFQPGWRGRRRSVGLQAVCLSLSWLVFGAVFFATGNNLARQSPFTVPLLHLAGWQIDVASRLDRFKAWAAATGEDESPKSPEVIHAWLKRAEQEARRQRMAKYDAVYAYMSNRVPVPPELHPRAIDREYVGAITRARDAAARASRRYDASHPLSRLSLD